MIRIYQLDYDKVFSLGISGRTTRELAFMPYESWLGKYVIPHKSIYKLVWSGTGDEHLDEIFIRFNVNHPTDFRGHSLSVSDVVVTEAGAFFVNDFGFRKVEWFEKDEFWLQINGKHLSVQESSEGEIEWTLYSLDVARVDGCIDWALCSMYMSEIDGGIYESDNYSEAVCAVISDYIAESLDGELPDIVLEAGPESFIRDYSYNGDCDRCGFGSLGECHLQCTT